VSGNDFFIVFEVRVFDFPGIGSILARAVIVGAVPIIFEVLEFKNELSPTVINRDLNL
jgi:hypothetical protein